MGTEIFKKIAAWYRENRKYDGFVGFVVFGFGSIFLLVCNILTDATKVDWLIWFIWLQSFLFQTSSWQKDMHRQEVTKFLIDRSAEMVENLANELAESQKKLDDALARITALRLHLIGANRRRKQAERKLKHAEKMYRFALEENIELMRCTLCGIKPGDEQPQS